MTPDLLRETGEALFGPRWQCELARALGVSDRTMRRWANGEWPIPGAIVDELKPHFDNRINQLEYIIDRLSLSA